MSCWSNCAAWASWTSPAPARTPSAFGRKGGELTGPNPVDRGKPGTKYFLLTDRVGIPLAAGVGPANIHDNR
jgi:hypothetical protein